MATEAATVAADDGHGCGGAYLEWPITPNLRDEFDWRWLYWAGALLGKMADLGAFAGFYMAFLLRIRAKVTNLQSFDLV